MSENDLRRDADKWECELMEEKLARLQKERDEAVEAEAVKDRIILKLEDQIQDLKKNCNAAVARIKKAQYKHSGKLWMSLAAVVTVALLAWVGVETGNLSVLVGEPVFAFCTVAAGFFAGWILNRELENLDINKRTAQKRKEE